MRISIDYAIDFVAKNSPASSIEDIYYMAKKLIEICRVENEPPERAWENESYWE